MKNVLVVDDEQTLLMIMVGRFEDYKDRFNVFTAGNGKEAVKVLESQSIDLVVTDLKMPEMDGVELLAHMFNRFPKIPAIAVSAYCTPEIQEKLQMMGILRVMDKPVNFDLLAQAVLKGLEMSHEYGSINCISLSSFLQIIHMEEKTCMLEVHGGNNQRGFIYMIQGQLYDAECGNAFGEVAAYKMLAWDNPHLYLKDLPQGKNQRRIKQGMMSVVMEGLRRKDEAAVMAQKQPNLKKPAAPPPPKPAAPSPPKPAAEPAGDADEMRFMAELDRTLGGLDEELPPPKADPPPKKTEPTPGAKPGAASSGSLFNLFQNPSRNGGRLQAFVDELRRIVPLDLALVLSEARNKQGYLAVDEVWAAPETTVVKGAVYAMAESAFEAVWQQKAPMAVPPSAFRSPVESELLKNSGMQSCLIIPILQESRVRSALVLAARKAVDWSKTAVNPDWMMGGLSLAFERDRLRTEVSRQREALSVVEQIGRALVSWNFDIEKVFRFSLDKVQNTLKVEAGTLFFREQDHLKSAVAFNTKKAPLKNLRMKVGQGIAGYVAAKGVAMMLNDTEKTTRFFRDVDASTGFETRSVLCVPLVAGRKVIGVLQVLNKIGADFDDSDELLLHAVASALSTAVIYAQKYRSASTGG
jgi:CheY-like chemotaxis protein/putative methionine-R-sulfoxide reductase with GAF domain